MLKNLTTKSFSPYGTVFSGDIHAAAGALSVSLIKRRITEVSTFCTAYVNFEAKTAIEKAEGTAILFCGKTPTHFESFLLDKTVILAPGVYYHVLPLEHAAEIAVCAKGVTKTVKTKKTERPGGMLPAIEPTEIFTLFHHKKERGFSFRGEAHNFWELAYAERGTLYNVVDGDTYALSEGEMMLFLPNQFHRQYAEPDARVFYITIGFSMHFPEPDLFYGKIFTITPEMRTLFRQIFEEEKSGNIYTSDMILSYLKQLLISLLRTQAPKKARASAWDDSRPALENEIVSKTEHYVIANLYKKLTVAEIAETIPVSESYLSSLFKRHTGESLNHYINRQKLSLAKDYIRSGAYTFTQIAQILGYNNVHYFSRCFKNYTGLTPSEYANASKGETI